MVLVSGICLTAGGRDGEGGLGQMEEHDALFLTLLGVLTGHTGSWSNLAFDLDLFSHLRLQKI